MEKRFGVRDFLLFAVLLMVLISVWLMMFQVDRQWEFISKVEKQIEELERSQKEIDLQLSEPEKFKELSRQEGFFEQYEKNQNIKKELESEWEQAIEALEHL